MFPTVEPVLFFLSGVRAGADSLRKFFTGGVGFDPKLLRRSPPSPDFCHGSCACCRFPQPGVAPSSPLTSRPGLGFAAPSSHDGPCPGIGTRHIGEWPVPAQVPEPVPAEGDICAESGGRLLRMPSERVHGSATVIRAVAAMRWRAPVFPRIGRTGQGPQVHRQESLPSQGAPVYERGLLGQPVLL